MEFLLYFQIFIFFLLVILVIKIEKGIHLNRPITMVSLIYILTFCIPTIYMSTSSYRFDSLSRNYLEDLNIGFLFMLFVYVFLILGYYFPNYNTHGKKLLSFIISKLPNINNFEFEFKKLPVLLAALYVLGWISRVIIIQSGFYFHCEAGSNIRQAEDFKVVANWVTIGSLFPMIVISIIFSEWLRNSKFIFFLIAGLMTFVEILYAIPSGSKERVLLPIIIVFFLYSIKRKFPVLPLIFLVLFFALFLFPFFGIYRSMVLTGDIVRDMSLSLSLYSDLFSRFDPLFWDELFYSIFGVRLNSAEIVTIIVNNTPRIWEFKLGYSYFMFLIAIIPRILWFNKPSISIWANDFGRDYGIISPVDYSTSIDVTWVGEMFLNFGWFGVLVGFCYGFLYRIAYNYFFQGKYISFLSMIFYAYLVYYMIRGGMFTIQFVGLFKFYLVLIFLTAPFMKRVQNNSS